MKRKNIIVGSVLILIAVTLILGSVGVIPSLNIFAGEISWLAAIACILLILYVIKKIIKGSISGIFIPLAVVFMLLEKNLAVSFGMSDKNIINNWILLLCAVLLEIGFSLLLKPQKNQQKNKLSSSVIYVDLQNNKNRYFSNSLGDLTIRFENIGQNIGESTIYIDNKLGDTVIEVPSDLYYVCKMQSKLGDILMEKNRANECESKLIIEGINTLGNVRIKIV